MYLCLFPIIICISTEKHFDTWICTHTCNLESLSSHHVYFSDLTKHVFFFHLKTSESFVTDHCP